MSEEQNTAQKIKIKFPYAKINILIDFLFRLISLGCFYYQFYSKVWLWIINIAIIPIIIIALVGTTHESMKKKYKIKETEDIDVDINIAGGVSWILLAIASITLIWLGLPEIHIGFKIPIIAIAGALFLAYSAMIVIFSPKEPPIDSEIARRIISSDPRNAKYEHEDNDVEIVKIEVTIASLIQRADAFALESTLFGALSFSAFVTIITSDRYKYMDYSKIELEAKSITSIIITHSDSARGIISTIISALQFDQLLLIIAILTIICSSFYLAVIASKLRFSKYIIDAQNALGIAKAYNEKEEQIKLLELQESDKVKANKFKDAAKSHTDKINTVLIETNLIMQHLIPAITYMSIFRKLGILTFIAILFASSLLLSKYLLYAFIILFLIAFLYSSIDNFFRGNRLREKISKIIYDIRSDRKP